MLSPERVCEIVDEYARSHEEPLQVYWLTTDAESRQQFAEGVRKARRSVGVVPVVVRSALLFTDANAVLSDLNRVLLDNRQAFAGVVVRHQEPVVVLLLARSQFRLGQAGSPIQLPDWFPYSPGCEVFVKVRDLAFGVEGVALNAPEARVAELSERLYELEMAIVQRIAAVFIQSPNASAELWAFFARVADLKTPASTVSERLAAYRGHLDAITTPASYRPVAQNRSSSLLSNLITAAQRSTPEGLLELSKALATALGISKSAPPLRTSLVALLLRPMRMGESARFAHNLVTVLYGSYQFLNACAHASDYAPVSPAFLFVNSADLRSTLRDAAVAIGRLGTPDR